LSQNNGKESVKKPPVETIEQKQSMGMPFYIIKKVDKEVVAWVLASAYGSTVDLIHIYTHPEHRRKSHATDVLQSLKNPREFSGKAPDGMPTTWTFRCQRIITEWGASSKDGRKLCVKAGFTRMELNGNQVLMWERTHIQTPPPKLKILKK